MTWIHLLAPVCAPVAQYSYHAASAMCFLSIFTPKYKMQDPLAHLSNIDMLSLLKQQGSIAHRTQETYQDMEKYNKDQGDSRF